MSIVVLGIDLGKNTCSLAGLDGSGLGRFETPDTSNEVGRLSLAA
jgi:hypothetical protein